MDWKLRALLEREGVTVYALAQKLAEASEQPMHMNTLYKWTNYLPSNPSIEAIGWILWGLKELTGKTFTTTDILDYHLEPTGSSPQSDE